MKRFTGFISCSLACLLGAMLSSSALSGEVQQPIKKPKDKTGAVIVSPADDDEPVSAVAPATPSDMAGHATPQAEPSLSRSSSKVKKVATEPPKQAEAAAPAQVTAPPAAKVAPAPIPTQWSEAEIKDATARCGELLKGIDVVSVPEPSFRSGQCGAPAAVRLISIGKSPQVSLDPPAVLTCEMVNALHTFVTQKVQPLAKKHLNSEIIKIETMSDYSCRNAYGRSKNKLSEHGRANALDVRGFVTSHAQQAYVLEHWGPVQREIAERIAAAKKAAEKAAQEKALAAAPAAKPAQNATATAQAPAVLKQTITDGTEQPSSVPSLAVPSTASPGATALGFEPSRLGGPEDKATDKVARVQAFLHAVHDAGCQIFGTTLGPEANKAHRNHFHFDMAPRKATKICE